MIKSIFKGWLGEGVTSVAMWLLLDKKVYRRFNNVIVPTANGTTQIDHVIVSPYGAFVIEIKNYKGWIYGSETQAKWTQSFPGGKKYQFQNPLHQNYRHSRCLAEYLSLDPGKMHSVVFFIGESTFKTAMPPNVLDGGLIPYIKSFNDPLLSQGEIGRIAGALERLKSDPTLTRRAHLKSLEERHNSTTICPKCGGKLVERTARQGPNAGGKFIGCSGWPRCNFARND